MLVAHRADDLGERRHLGLRKTRGRLVHEHEPRLRRERSCDSEPPLVAVRERLRRAHPRTSSSRSESSSASARRRASRGPRPTPSAATSTFSRTERPRNERLCWNVRERPARPRRCGLQRVTSRPFELDGALVREVEPGEDVHERRLAGSVRADETDDLVPVQLERHAPKRLHALEGARDGGGPERCSGPPCLFRLCFRQAPQIFGRPWP